MRWDDAGAWLGKPEVYSSDAAPDKFAVLRRHETYIGWVAKGKDKHQGRPLTMDVTVRELR